MDAGVDVIEVFFGSNVTTGIRPGVEQGLAIRIIQIIGQNRHETDDLCLGDATCCKEYLGCHKVGEVLKDIGEAYKDIVAGLVNIKNNATSIFSTRHRKN
jgi:hypothetical protein